MSETTHFAQDLANATIGCRVKFTWLGQSKALDDSQQAQAAALFGADVDFLKTAKRLLDNKQPEFREVVAIRGKINKLWKLSTLPYVEPGIRLLKRSAVEQFADEITGLSAELFAAVETLNDVYSDMLSEARTRLGSLYNPADYPESLRGAFSVSFDFPNLNAPDYLAQISPELYQRESARVRQQFERSVELAEQAFAAELQSMIERITETLSGSSADGKPRVFRDSMVNNLTEFIGRFRSLSIGSSEQLETLVNQAEQAISGKTAAELRESSLVRDELVSSMRAIGDSLQAAAIERPARVIRFNRQAEQAEPASDSEPQAEPAPESIDDNQQAEPQAPQAETAEPSAAVESAETADSEPQAVAEPVETVAFTLNYGNGRTERLVLPANRQAIAS